MIFLNKSFVSLSLVLSGCLYGKVIQTDETLDSLVSDPSAFNTIPQGGTQPVVSIANLLINSKSPSINIAINPQNTTVGSFSTTSTDLYGIFSNTSANLLGSKNEKLIFHDISTQSANITGIKGSSIVLDSASIIFQSISRTGSVPKNAEVFGIVSHANQGLNLSLKNNASITFKSVTSQGDFGYVTGIATGLNSVSSSIDVSQGNIRFNLLSGVEHTSGITFQATTNTFRGQIIFDHIESTGELVYNGKPITRNAYGISFAPSASAILKENSRIYITSMASKGSIYPLFAQQSLSLTLERNAGLIYGAISESEKVNSYGIYAKTDKTLDYYFGAGDPSGDPQVDLTKAQGTTFKSITSIESNNAYGMYLQTTTQANFNINGKVTFENIQADSRDAYGIYAVGNMSLQGVAGGEKKISFTNIASQNGEVAGLAITQDSSLNLGGGLKITFKAIDAGKYAIKNQGKIIINQSDLLSFGTDQVAGYAISNTLENLVYELGETEVGNGSVPITMQYGFYNTAGQIKLNGNLSVRKFTSSSPFSLIYYGGTQAGAMEIDNLSISAYGDKTASNLLGFNASQDFQLTLNNTLNITLMDETFSTKYEAINTPRSEGVAFGENISLKLGENAKVIFNANGGKLKSLSNLDNQSGGIISLAGEIKEAQEPTNRIWQDGGNARSFNARHLEIQNLQTQQTQFVLYADKGAKVANYANNDLYGKAYVDGAKASTDRTAFGGSDSITISGATPQGGQPLSNNLIIELGGLNGDNKDISQNVVLAIVDSSIKDKVVFNGLTKSGDSVLVKTYSGFDTLDLEIKRFDTESGNSFYYSNLVAYNPKVNTDYLAPIFNSLNVNFLALSGNFNSLSKRLGDLKNEVNSNGVWARVFGGKQTMDFGIKTDQTYVTTQMGYDYALDCTDAKNFIGIALSYNYASSTQDQTLYTQGGTSYANSAKTQGVEVALYNTYQSNDGLYSDSIAKVGYFVSDLDLYRANLSNYSNFAFTLSEEVGYEFGLGESKEWMITPQGELAYAFMNGKDVSIGEFASTLNLASQDLHLLRMRVGANWGYRFNNASSLDQIKALLYLGTYYEYDAIFGGDMTFSNSIAGSTTYNGMSSNGRFVLNLGVDMQIFEETKLYLDVEKSFGNKMSKEYQVNFGVRYSFGDKIEILPKEEEKKLPLPLSIPQEENQQENTSVR